MADLSVNASRRVTSRVAALAVVLLLGLSGCGQKDYRYVSSSEYGNFFRLPVNWRYADVTAEERSGRPLGEQGGVDSVWHVQFSNAAAANVTEDDIAGSANVFTLTNYYRETYSISKIRSQLFLGVDPVYPSDDFLGRVELVDYRPLESGRLTGARVVANINVAEAGETANWTTIDTSMLFDDAYQAGRVYALSMRCSGECYEAHRAKVDEIAGSWKVKKP